MKTKFHLNKRPHLRPAFGTGAGAEFGQAVALIDERYLSWLAQQQPNPPSDGLHRDLFQAVFSQLARLCGAEAALLRSYLYTDQQPAQLLDDVVLRMVPAHASDGGAALVRTLGLELTQLASQGGCALVLLASDDERLIPYIDEAQWRGLKVVMVTDASAQDFGRLLAEDPSWARLLMQADRRVSLNEAAWAALKHGQAEGLSYTPTRPAQPERREFEHEHEHEHGAALGEPAHADQQPDGAWLEHVQQVIDEWWREETPHARLDLYEEMQSSQGVPPETDRHLLLRVRRGLGRTLSFPEKKAMREMIRAAVLAQLPVADEALDH
ncbi:MAG: hypothetical protein JM57_01780 [Comamonadaceae bacterium BICA1-1]|nr:MAG: hypothetical protein JM57_01780 [Comamonadaceae bacterium BICA1-1]